MAEIHIDESRWPLVVIEWPAGTITDADIEDFLRRSTAQLARGERFGSLHDGVRASGLDSKQRKRMSEHVNLSRALLRRWHVAAAIVADSAMVRGMITAINWVSPPPFPQKQFATRAEAESWLLGMLEADRGSSASRPR